MALLYLESSALIKRYVPEKGSEVLDALLDGAAANHRIVASVLTVLEQKSALSRAVRSGDISRADMREALAEFASDRAGFALMLSIDDDLIEAASGLMDRYPLRSLDAIHLASAFRISEIAKRTGDVFAVVCSDHRLVAACREAGLEVINPEDEGAHSRLLAMG